MNYKFFAVILITPFSWTACTSSQNQSNILTGTVAYPNGRIKTLYSYYVNRQGKEVLQGTMLQFPPPGGPTGIATKSVYNNGRLVEGPHETAVSE